MGYYTQDVNNAGSFSIASREKQEDIRNRLVYLLSISDKYSASISIELRKFSKRCDNARYMFQLTSMEQQLNYMEKQIPIEFLNSMLPREELLENYMLMYEDVIVEWLSSCK
jgi:hypothetical protein